MSWLSELLDPGDSASAPKTSAQDLAAMSNEQWDALEANLSASNPSAWQIYKQFDPRPARKAEEAQVQQTAQTQQQTTTAQALNPYAAPPPPPPPDTANQEAMLRANALAGLGGVFPTGFEQSLIPGTLDDPFIEQRLGSERGKAQDFLNRLLSRGTVTGTGRVRGLQAIEGQAPGVRTRLEDVGNLLLEQERAGLRGIASAGQTAAGGLTVGQSFDPETYGSQARQRAGAFTSSFGDTFGAAAPTGDLFDVSGLSSTAGAVTGPRAFVNEPYAPGAAGGSEVEQEAPIRPTKRRSAVF